MEGTGAGWVRVRADYHRRVDHHIKGVELHRKRGWTIGRRERVEYH